MTQEQTAAATVITPDDLSFLAFLVDMLKQEGFPKTAARLETIAAKVAVVAGNAKDRAKADRTALVQAAGHQ